MAIKTPMYDLHVEQGGLMVNFAGYHLPLHYGSQVEEHNYVRNDVGIFDVSHMTTIDVTGKEAKEFLLYLLANNVDKLKEPGKALYGCMLNDQGGIIDDLITYFVAPEFYRLIVNASTKQKVLTWIKNKKTDFYVEIKHRDDLAMVAIQGPNARKKVIQELGANLGDIINNLKPFNCSLHDDWFIARTGYTGEDGIEIVLPGNEAQDLWRNLTSKNIKPIGLGARDTLRLEAGLNLYGNDMDETVTPYESNLSWTVAMEPADRKFIGRDALENKVTKNNKKLIGLTLIGKGILRAEQKVFSGDIEIGRITSGTYSPTLKQSIAFARVNHVDLEEYLVDIRGRKVVAKKVKLPFVKKQKN